MTQKQFNQDFKETYPNFRVMTLTDRRLTYNDLMETYRQNGNISEIQAKNWGHPKFLTTNKNLINCNAY